MEKTPKHPRKSLSLGRILNRKRHSVSPQGHLHSVRNSVGSAIDSAGANTPRSPSVISISSDCGIECTPPHKKFNFDDSLDYSPHTHDTSFSPSGLLSQTLSTESPEVGWKWNRSKFSVIDEIASATPDSAYAADSSYTSAGSSSTEAQSSVRTRGDTNKHRQTLAKRKLDQRKAVEQQQRKAEKLKMDEMLKRRCAKLQEQLKDAQKNTLLEKEAETRRKDEMENKKNKMKTPIIGMCTRQAAAAILTPQDVTASDATTSVKTHDSINDFFNDSESDCFLLEATQQLESQIVSLTQKPVASPTKTTNNIFNKNKGETAVVNTSSSPVTTTPRSSCKKKQQSSLYSKFFEDDSADDWFVSLDEVILQATQKPRSSFQRYKSMPIDSSIKNAGAIVCTSAPVTTFNSQKSEVGTSAVSAEATTKGFKRHASSHTLSPSSTSSADSTESHLNFSTRILENILKTETDIEIPKGRSTIGFRCGTKHAFLEVNDLHEDNDVIVID